MIAQENPSYRLIKSIDLYVPIARKIVQQGNNDTTRLTRMDMDLV